MHLLYILPSSSEANSNKAACGWSMEKSKQIASKSTVSLASTVFFHFQKSYGNTFQYEYHPPSYSTPLIMYHILPLNSPQIAHCRSFGPFERIR